MVCFCCLVYIMYFCFIASVIRYAQNLLQEHISFIIEIYLLGGVYWLLWYYLFILLTLPLFVCHIHSPGTCFLEGHEAFISNSCFVVGGIQSLLVNSEAGIITLGPGKEGSAKLLIPSGAIPQGQQLQVKYAVLLDGPFSIPVGYNIVSPVLYIDYNTSLVKKPLQLHLNHWYAGEDRQKSMTFLKAPHVADESGLFPFAKYMHGSFSDDEQLAVFELKEDLCCVVVAVKKTENFHCPANCRLHLLKKVQPDSFVSFRLYVTFDHSAWTEVCHSHCHSVFVYVTM